MGVSEDCTACDSNVEISQRMRDRGFYQCNPTLSSYDVINCSPVLVAGVKKLGTNLWLDTSTDIDLPTAGKTVDSLLCQNAQFVDYPVIASIQGSNGITPDQYDFYGQTLRTTDT